MKILIKNARVIQPSAAVDRLADVLIEQQTITAIEPSLSDPEAQILDAEGLWLLPGLVDIHVHLREPGQEGKETIATGTRAAAAGGITSLLCMPNTIPPIDSRTGIDFILERTERSGCVRVFPTGTITKGLEGKELAPIGEMVEAGAVAVTEETEVMDSLLMRRAMEYTSMFNVPLIAHCEDKQLTENGSVNEGRMSMMLGLTGIPCEAEAVMVARNILLAAKTGVRLHLAHISCAESVDLIRFYKQKGAPVTAEVTPHHLLLLEDATDQYQTNAKVDPPLRTPEDQEALYQGLRDGTIDCIATAHAPHTQADKSREFPEAESGIIGLETLLPLLLGPIRERLGFDLPHLLGLVTHQPARVMKLPVGVLATGQPADLVLWNPEPSVTIDRNQFHSKARNTPFHGWTVQGRVEQTFVAGGMVYHRERNEFKSPPRGILPLR
jgi:dihydroorotase